MTTAVDVSVDTSVRLVRLEVERFLRAARLRSEYSGAHLRRVEGRYHRSWPLQVTTNLRGRDLLTSAALHNVSSTGIAFMSSSRFEPGQRVFIKLFACDQFSTFVPAVIRHIAEGPHGHLIGCEFEFTDSAACREAVSQSQPPIPVDTVSD